MQRRGSLLVSYRAPFPGSIRNFETAECRETITLGFLLSVRVRQLFVMHTCTFTHSEKPQTFVVDQATNFEAVTKGTQEFVTIAEKCSYVYCKLV